MRIAIMGAGAIAYASAAFLLQSGHDVAIWSLSGRRTKALAAGAPLTAENKVTGSFHPVIAATCEEALRGADAVLVGLPANGHKGVMDAMAPHLAEGQAVIISSHASLGAAYLKRLVDARALDVMIVALSTTILRARQTSDTSVKINTLRGKIDMATVPSDRAEAGLALMVGLFGERFRVIDNVLAVALSNVNPQSHMALALCNFTRMEKAEAWGQSENMTMAVGHLLEAIDAERLAVADAFSVKVRTMREHYSLTYGVPDAPIGETAQILAAKNDVTYGPATIDTRYTLEDVPFGLLPMVTLGDIAGVPTPLHRAGLAIFSALYGRDLAGDNDIMPALMAQGLSRDELVAICG
jgi:opine dehydrogenase